MNSSEILKAVRSRLGKPKRRLGIWWRLTYLNAKPPKWCEADPLIEQYRSRALLLREGQVVWGVGVVANRNLWAPGKLDHPATVIYSTDPRCGDDVDWIQDVAYRLIGLLYSEPSNDAEAQFREMLSDSKKYTMGTPVPASCSGGLDVMSTSVVVIRKHLPRGVMVQFQFPILIHPATTAVMIVPSKYWPRALVRDWNNTPRESRLSLSADSVDFSIRSDDQPAEVDSKLLFRCGLTAQQRLILAATSLMAWGLVALIGISFLLQYVLFPRWKPTERFNVALIASVLIGLVAAWRTYMTRYHMIRLHPDRLELESGGKTERIPRSEIMALIGQGGINLIEKGDDVIAWKRLVILTEDGMHSLAFDPEANTGLYWILRRYCPQAWGVPFPAGIHAPTEAAPTNQWTREVLARIENVYRSHVARAAIAALALIVVSMLALVGLIVFGRAERNFGMGFVYLAAFFVAGVVFLGRALGDLRTLRQIREAAE